MEREADSPARWRRIDAAARAVFLAALRRGASREEAAAEAGFSLMGFYGGRRRDAAFDAGWKEALAASAAAERRTRAYAERDGRRERGACPERGRGEVRIACANRRFYQRRWRRNVRFDEDRQAAFLTRFAADCDTKAAAEAAGVSESTVHRHCRTDRAFAEAYAEALAEGYVRLEAETLRQRLAAQARLRAAVEAYPPRDGEGDHPKGGGGGSARGAACPECGRSDDAGEEFERALRLLARRDRKPHRVQRGFKPGGQRQAWTFDRAMELLEKRLRAMGVPNLPPPEEE